MKTNKLAITLVLAGALAVPGLARAQVGASVQLSLGLPVVMPQLVVVSPGIQVVPEVEEEVFFTRGYYWCRYDGGWYRTRDVRRGWYYMEPRHVPPGLTRMPPGKYKKYRPARYAPARGGPGPVRYAPARAHQDDRGGHDRGGYDDRGGHDRGGQKHKGGHGNGKHGRD